jgi:PASTA domain
VKRWFVLLPAIFAAGLFAALHATAATKTAKDTNASSSIVNLGGGQFRWNVTQLSPDSEITTFALASGAGFAPSSVMSVNQPGSCSVSGRNVSCNVPLMLAPCTCQPGGTVDIVLQASGDPAGSSLQVNGATFPVQTFGGGGGPTTTTATTTAPTTTTPTTPPPPVANPVCVVPKLAGKTLAAAKAALRAAHCGIGPVQSVKSGLKKGLVVSSVPGAGHRSKAGTRVVLRISSGRK